MKVTIAHSCITNRWLVGLTTERRGFLAVYRLATRPTQRQLRKIKKDYRLHVIGQRPQALRLRPLP